MKKVLFALALLLVPSLIQANDMATLMGKDIDAISTISGKAKTAISTFMGGGVPVASSGQSFSDDFTYSNGELATVSSGAWAKLTGTDSNVSSNVFTLADSTIYLYATDTDTVSQYVAAVLASDPNEKYSGLYARQEATDNATTKAYALRNNSGTHLDLRYCTGTSCTTISSPDPGTIGTGDSIGMEVVGTGSSTQWKIWYWDNATPPARESWGTCDYGVYITGQSAPGCDSDAAISDLGANYANSGKYTGLYSGGYTQSFDNWMAGDVE